VIEVGTLQKDANLIVVVVVEVGANLVIVAGVEDKVEADLVIEVLGDTLEEKGDIRIIGIVSQDNHLVLLDLNPRVVLDNPQRVLVRVVTESLRRNVEILRSLEKDQNAHSHLLVVMMQILKVMRQDRTNQCLLIFGRNTMSVQIAKTRTQQGDLS